ncbi:MAG: redox-regulated ATPase YchF [Nanoarchaeota archaeon]|nr:redox-regulated ATPase YchF [Nanoarchaeota archaeon]
MLIGIVGKPSCGKSTFFKAATLADVEIANYPFTTIKPNHAVGYVKVPCAETNFGVKCDPRVGYCIDGIRFVPIDLLDVAGLIPGAHKGEGLGLSFLNDLNQADVLVHVIDISGSINEKGEPVEPGQYDPLNDVKFLEDELDYWYLGILKKGWERLARQMVQEKSNPAKVLGKQLSGLGANEDVVGQELRKLNINKIPTQWTEEELLNLASSLRKKTKPMIIAANKIDMPGAAENLERLKEKHPEYIIIPCSAESELALKEATKKELLKYIPGDKTFTIEKPDGLNDKQKAALAFIKTNILDKFGSTGIQDVLNDAIFKLLKYIAIFPGGVNKLEDKDGNVLPDCFLIKDGSTALDFAYKIHTDLGDKFIRAIHVKKKLTIGKDHVLHNLDVIEIISNK